MLTGINRLLKRHCNAVSPFLKFHCALPAGHRDRRHRSAMIRRGNEKGYMMWVRGGKEEWVKIAVYGDKNGR
jgi:hypothetical protein